LTHDLAQFEISLSRRRCRSWIWGFEGRCLHSGGDRAQPACDTQSV